MLTRSRTPGIASTWLGKKPLARRRRWTIMAPTTAVMKVVQMRKASRYLRAVPDENSNMKLWLILVLFHRNRLHPYMNRCKLNKVKTLPPQKSGTKTKRPIEFEDKLALQLEKM